MSSRRLPWIAILVAGLLAGLPGTLALRAAAAGSPLAGAMTPMPVASRLLGWLGGRPQGLIAGQRLDRGAGWSDVRWEPGTGASGLYLEVAGRVRFREAAILFADGGALHLDLRRVE